MTELGEPDNASYRRYADLKRPAAVWNVVAAPELSLTLQTWCFVVVGCVGYRGYYDLPMAEAFAAEQRSAGLETSVYAVPAYSTLGALPFDWLADPLLNTFIDYPEGELARLIFHELAHQIAYAAGDTGFNESFATAVERIGGERWLATRAGAEARAEFERSRRAAPRLPRADGEVPERARRALPQRRVRCRQAQPQGRAVRGAARRVRGAEARALGRVFRVRRRGSRGPTMRRSAFLPRTTTRCPQFMRLFERSGGDFGRFYAEVRRLAALSASERRAALER